MKNIFIVTALALSCTAAFAGEGQQSDKTKIVATSNSVTNSAAVSTAQNAGNSQTITVAPVTTNVASDLKDQGATAAAINGAAQIEIAKILSGSNSNTSGIPGAPSTQSANTPLTNAELRALADLEIARINAKVVGDRDLGADQRAALDREAAKEIATIQQTVKNTPSIGIGQLTSSNDTCMGSVSVGGSGPGFSIGVGTTYTDDNCKMLKNSRELWNMGMKAASLALMCTNAANREALEITGFECPQTTAAKKAEADKAAASAKVATETGYTGSDPIVQARMTASK